MGACCCCCYSAGAKLETWEIHPSVRFDGKTVIITGSNTGIGKETAREFALRGARVILACRSKEPSEAAAEDIRRSLREAADPDSPAALKGSSKKKRSASSIDEQVVFLPLDLGELRSVYAFVDAYEELGVKCDILVNSAGVMNTPKQTTSDGLEFQIGINHFGHFALTTELINRGLIASEDARIINLTSDAHNRGRMDFDDMFFEHRAYGGWSAYGQSKLANILFTRELIKRHGDDYVIAAVHPGYVRTELSRNSGCCTRCCIKVMVNKTPNQGASTTIWTATADADVVKEHSTHYFENCAPSDKVTELAKNDDDAARLWDFTEQTIADKMGNKKGGRGKKAWGGSGKKSGAKKASKKKSESSASASASSSS